MAEYGNRVRSVGTVATPAVDAGLRSYMLRVYNYMLAGLALTGGAVLAVLNTPLMQLFFTVDPTGQFITGMSMLGWVAFFAPLAMVFFLSFRIQSMSFSSAQITFWVFAAVMGIGLAPVFLMYTGASVARVFFITSATFGAMSLWGYTTKRDLTGWGSFLFMGLIGIIIASLVNLFMQSSMMEFVISVIGVIIFTGLTAYDTQKIKESYSVSMSGEIAGKAAIMGALRLYLDFLNLFLMLLRLLGDRR
jgi:FtsH-binding integral membrane protein